MTTSVPAMSGRITVMTVTIDCLFAAIICAFLVVVAQSIERKKPEKKHEVKDDPNTDDTFPF